MLSWSVVRMFTHLFCRWFSRSSASVAHIERRSNEALFTAQRHTRLGFHRAPAFVLAALVGIGGCTGASRFIAANDNSGGSPPGDGSRNQNDNTPEPSPNDNGNVNDNVPPGPTGGLEGLWSAEVDDPNADLPATVVFRFDDRDEVVGMSVAGTQVNEQISRASTTRLDNTIQIVWTTDGGIVVYNGELSGDGDRITGLLSDPLTFGSDETFTIPRGTLVINRTKNEPPPDPNPQPEPQPDPQPEPDPGMGTLVALDPITFFGDVPAGVDPATFAIGGGAVVFQGGVSGTLALPGLYFGFVDSFAWVPAPGTSTVSFDGLDVRRVDFYFADVGAPGATLVVEDENGETIDTVQSQTTMIRGDTRPSFSVGDVSSPPISRLVIETPTGVTASLDQLVIWVIQ